MKLYRYIYILYIYGYKWQPVSLKEKLSPKWHWGDNNSPLTFHVRITSPVGKCVFFSKYTSLKRQKFLQLSTWWLKTKHYNLQKKHTNFQGINSPSMVRHAPEAVPLLWVDFWWMSRVEAAVWVCSRAKLLVPSPQVLDDVTWFMIFFAFVLKSIEVQRYG